MKTPTATLIAFALALAATPVSAIAPPVWPRPVEEAPIERAIANVTANFDMPEAQRERLLGRLHLIGYAQHDPRLNRYSSGEWTLPRQLPCGAASPPNRYPCGDITSRPPKELPETIDPPVDQEARVHLREARVHYTRAVELDGNILRVRLGLAYVLDKLGEEEAARVQLRKIIAIGSSLLQRRIFPDDHAVLSEAVMHLSGLAISRTDQNALIQLRQLLGEKRPVITVTPMVIPLFDSSFETMIDPESSVAFDFDGIGNKQAFGWLTPDAAWLVWDPNRRGKVESGFALIGQRTWAVFWTDGFEVLRALDDDKDGELTGAELSGLALWRDANGDGISDASEVLPIADHGIVGLSTQGIAKRLDLIVAPKGVRLQDGKTRPLYDWTPGLNSTEHR